MINNQSTFRTSANVCKNISLAVLFVSNGNSYTVPTHLGMCAYVCMYVCMYVYIYIYIYIYIYSSQYREGGLAQEITKDGAAVKAACQ